MQENGTVKIEHFPFEQYFISLVELYLSLSPGQVF